MKQEKIIAKNQKGLNKESLYTFIMNFKGGTYISQVKGDDEKEACQVWAISLNIDDIEGFDVNTRLLIFKELENEEATQITGTKNVWIIGLDLSGNFAIVHIIKTVKNQ